MRITEKLMVKDQLISFEVFPPKTDSAFDSIEWSVRELAAFNPDFMSVTYGAGGGTSQYTTKIASLIKNRLDTTALAHLTCASTPKDKIVTHYFKEGTEPPKDMISPRYVQLNNPNNLNVKITDKTATLTFESVKIPDYYTEEFMEKYNLKNSATVEGMTLRFCGLRDR